LFENIQRFAALNRNFQPAMRKNLKNTSADAKKINWVMALQTAKRFGKACWKCICR
jgi:hypothetical protein